MYVLGPISVNDSLTLLYVQKIDPIHSFIAGGTAGAVEGVITVSSSTSLSINSPDSNNECFSILLSLLRQDCN